MTTKKVSYEVVHMSDDAEGEDSPYEVLPVILELKGKPSSWPVNDDEFILVEDVRGMKFIITDYVKTNRPADQYDIDEVREAIKSLTEYTWYLEHFDETM